MANVELEHVEKVFAGGTRAIGGLDLQVADGELVVLVGPSGCGKSTLLRLVAGLEEVTSGRLRIGGREVSRVRPQERNVAMVFQDYALYPHLTARGNIEFPLRMQGVGRDERGRRVESIAALLDMSALLDRLPRELSGGQRQRVAMGRALVREPAVSLLDEPLSNLDAKLRVQVRAEIKEIQRRTRTTMIYVTHDQVEAMTLGDRVVVLDRGRLQQVAPPRELYARPANAFVAGFIGNPPMNLLPAQLITRDDGTLGLQIGGEMVVLAGLGEREPRLRALVGSSLSAGIRPEALRLLAAGDAGGVRARIRHVEALGHETLAYVEVEPSPHDGQRVALVVRVPGLPELAPGTPVKVALDAARLHLFDADGRALDQA